MLKVVLDPFVGPWRQTKMLMTPNFGGLGVRLFFSLMARAMVPNSDRDGGVATTVMVVDGFVRCF